MQYRCNGCGCYLDPGEGHLCDECKELRKQRVEQRENQLVKIVYQSARREVDYV